ncbi:MAG: hypothetical protein CMO66_01180 [Verrucomicrobiales bacterium]|nr:hypothetical protein [Verrucomicrobiales bacterium]
MNKNKWTVGLAAAGVIGLASVAQAQDANSVQTKLATTTLSGYVSTSYQWTPGETTGTAYTQGDARANRFALDVVSLTLASPTSSGEWGAGYNVQLWAGTDADDLGVAGGADGDEGLAVKNAYLTLNLPVGTGIDLNVGRFDTILGMESVDYINNPHFSHSWGYAIEPTIHEGIKGSYQLTDNIGVTGLLANTIEASSAGSSNNSDRKTWGAALNLTAPDSLGFLAGSTLDIAYISGDTDGGSNAVENLYVGASVPVPVDKLSAGVAWDVREVESTQAGGSDSVVGVYLEYEASEKLTLNVRGERVEDGNSLDVGSSNGDAWDLTVTANYDLWAGVISRVEYRYTVLDNPTTNIEDSHSIFLNLIYGF